MLYNYEECIELFGSNYFLEKALLEGKIFKIDSGLYSTDKKVKDIEVFLKKHKGIVFTMESALYYLGISDFIPNKYVVATDKDATKYKEDGVKQYFINGGLIRVGAIDYEYNGTILPIYNKERMLIEVIRNRNKLPFDCYKETINYYRDHIEDIDISLALEYLELFPKKKLIIKTIQLEVL